MHMRFARRDDAVARRVHYRETL